MNVITDPAGPLSAGSGTLTVRVVGGQSAVTAARALSPLKLLTPRARGASVWVCTSSFGGGLVAGDQTRLDLRIENSARCYLGTQASTKIYRNPAQAPCGHVTRALLGPGALLVFAPDPVQAFADSCYTQRQEFHLAPDASLVLLDWFTAGRTARGERWQFRRLRSRNAVHVAPISLSAAAPAPGSGSASASGVSGSAAASASGIDPMANSGSASAAAGPTAERPASTLAFLDSVALDADEGPLTSSHRTGRFNCFATLLLLGPAVSARAGTVLDDVRQRAVERASRLLASASPVRDGVVLRLAGEEVEQVGAELRRHLTPLSALLGDDPWARKW